MLRYSTLIKHYDLEKDHAPELTMIMIFRIKLQLFEMGQVNCSGEDVQKIIFAMMLSYDILLLKSDVDLQHP